MAVNTPGAAVGGDTTTRRKRFAGLNVPNLHYLEDRTYGSDGSRVSPTLFEMEDALEALTQLSSYSVTRIYCLSIYSDTGSPQFHINSAANVFNQTSTSTTSAQPQNMTLNTDTTSWHLIPGTSQPQLMYNADLFAGLDQAIAIAGSKGVRLIIPFIDRWDWWGGIAAFSKLHNLAAPDMFFTDPGCVSNFLALVKFVVNRTNTITNIRYCDDPTIWAWETGNEIQLVANSYVHGPNGRPPASWTISVGRAVKEVLASSRLLSNQTSNEWTQLVADGSFGSINGWDDQVLADPAIDAFTGHYYNMGITATIMSDIVISSSMIGVIIVLLIVFSVVACWPCISRRCTQRKLRKNAAATKAVATRPQSCQTLLHNGETSESEDDTQKSSSVKVEQTSEYPITAPTADPTMNRKQPKRLDGIRLLRHILLFLLLVGIAIAAWRLGTSAQSLYNEIHLTYSDRLKRDTDLVVGKHNKIYFVGEYGLTSADEIEDLLNMLVNDTRVAGALIWSLRFHARDGGWYTHSEGGPFWAYHFPGWWGSSASTHNGFGGDEKVVIQAIAAAAAKLDRQQNHLTQRDLKQRPPTPAPTVLPPSMWPKNMSQIAASSSSLSPTPTPPGYYAAPFSLPSFTSPSSTTTSTPLQNTTKFARDSPNSVIGVPLRWRGSAGAASYIIERAWNLTGPWSVITEDASDNFAYDDPQVLRTGFFLDTNVSLADAGAWYRVTAKSAPGFDNSVLLSSPSAPLYLNTTNFNA